MFVRESRFREDLYYRINAFAIRLPSLRERAVDIPVLANRFLARYCAANGLPLDAKQFSPEVAGAAGVVSLARQHPRARKHRLARRAVGAGPRRSAPPTSSSCTATRCRARKNPSTRLPSLRDAERAHIIRVLEATEWNKLEAAKVLDISRGTLYRKIEEYGLEPAAGSGRRRGRTPQIKLDRHVVR